MKKFTTSTTTNNNSDYKLYVNNDITMDDIMDAKINDDNDDTNNDDNTNNIYDIIILGAGLAGLGAGYCLKQYENEINSKEKNDDNDNDDNNYDNGHITNSTHTAGNNRIINNEKKCHKNLKFIILEAQDYIGGRIRTVHMKNNDNHHNINNDHTNIINNKGINEHNNTTSTTTTTTLPSPQPSQNNPSLNLDKFSDIIDSGAQWLHGDYNKLYHIANDYKLLSNEISEEGIGSYICDNGDIIDVNFQNKISYKIGQILEECENFINIYDNNNIKDNDHDDIDYNNKKKLINNKNNDYPKSVGDYLKDKFFEYLKQEEINYIEENYKKYKIMNNDNRININENDDDNNDLIKIKDNFYIKYKKNALKIYDWHKRFEIIDNSCLNLEQLSTKYWGLYTLNFNSNVSSSQQAHINFKMGFSTIIYNAILKNFINFLDNIKLNTEICDINWNIMNIINKNYNNLNNYYYYNNYNDDNNINNDYINIKKNKIKYKNNIMNLIRIKTCNNRIYYAKHIIITFSLGVLKSNMHKLFKPNLPDIYMNAINTIGYETINKIFLQFDIEWWLPMNGIQLLFDDYDNYENCKWTRYISGFDVLKPGAPNTLIGWVGSYGAIEMEKLTDQEIVEDCITLLREFTKKDVPYPIRYFFSSWNSNKFIRGSYSFLSTKCEKLNITGKFLSEPITLNDLKLMNEIHYENGSDIVHGDSHNNDDDSHNGISSSSFSFLFRDINEKNFYEKSYPLLLFAGEACHEKYFSTAHGAFESGYEQAKKILQFYNE